MSMRLELFRSPITWLILSAAIVSAPPVDATDTPPPEVRRSVTTADPAIAVDELELWLTPLTAAELAVEAEGWRALLKAKAVEIAATEVAVKRKNAEIERVEALVDFVAEAREAAEGSSDGDQGAGTTTVGGGEEDRSGLGETRVLAQERIEEIAGLEVLGLRSSDTRAYALPVGARVGRVGHASRPFGVPPFSGSGSDSGTASCGHSRGARRMSPGARPRRSRRRP